MTRRLAIILAVIGLATSYARAESPPPAEAMADVTRDGAWCWFSEPRAVSRDGKTHTGWVTRDGSIQAACLDHASGAVSMVTLHENTSAMITTTRLSCSCRMAG